MNPTSRKWGLIFGVVSVGVIAVALYFFPISKTTVLAPSAPATTATALFANGCFWCVEADLEKLPGVLKVVSGYAGGASESPTYENYAAAGHREVVEASYDPSIVSYSQLV